MKKVEGKKKNCKVEVSQIQLKGKEEAEDFFSDLRIVKIEQKKGTIIL